MRLGFGEILVILVIALLVFGPTKLPQLGDALGKGIRNFKKASEGLFDDDEKKSEPALKASESPPAAQAPATEKAETKKA
ncbi:MAG TPA: twin-arginine translocase TatA/TatE family subunit [Anaeromyxobacteraceae bacterium]|nr:twin-arginine translocase TatA/TatE family subunit [Anaeromyxobacteraceae bacterium]